MCTSHIKSWVINRITSIIILYALSNPFIIGQSALEFTSPTSYIQIADHPEIHLSEFTLECWIQPNPGGGSISTSATGVYVYPIISRGSTQKNYLLGLREQDGVLFFEFDSYNSIEDNYDPYLIIGSTPLQYGKWYHIAATCSETEMSLYVNGKLDARVEIFGQPYTNIAQNMAIATSLTTFDELDGSFYGHLDAVRVWNYARSQQQIIANLNSEILENISGLLLGLNLNEGTGSSIAYLGEMSSPTITANNISWVSDPDFSTLIPPLTETERELRVGLISDPQYCDCDPPGWAERYYRKSLNKLPVAVDTFNNANADLVVTVGDVIDTFFVSYDSILPLNEGLEMDYYFTIGNHELGIKEAEKPEVIGLLNMPHYYYALNYPGWRFLFLDGTELARYARSLHPELAEEGDSLYNAVQGKYNDKPWNGGIGRAQQQWMRQQIEDADNNEQHVIAFCHFPVAPDSVSLNLWNNDTIINLLSEYDNVVAYLNGHHHYGNYDFRNGQHYYTNYAMVESANSNSFAYFDLSANTVELSGFGLNPDRIMRFENMYQNLEAIQITNTTLNYNTDSSDFIGLLNIPNRLSKNLSFGIIGNKLYPDNQLFTIKHDSLFLNASPDYLSQEIYSVKIGGIDNLFDSVSLVINLELDNTIAIPKTNLPDTTIHIGAQYSFSLSELYTDFSRYGLTFDCEIEHPEIASYTIRNDSGQILANQVGGTFVTISAFDGYTNTILTEDFYFEVVPTTDSELHFSTLQYLKFSIYPNPAKEFIEVQFAGHPTIRYAIYNIHGHVVQYDHSSGKKIDISNLPSGIYYFIIVTNNMQYGQTLIIN